MFAPSALFISLVIFVAGTSAVPSLFARDNSTCSSSGAQCNTGTVSCCQTTYPSDNDALRKITDALGTHLPSDSEGFVGLGCSPISVIAAGSGAVCTQQPVCCSGNTYYGLINIGCSPINIYL